MGIPDTVSYMYLGYAVFTVVMGLYLFSLWLRQRNLHADERLLEELEQKE